MGIPPLICAWREGIWPWPAWSTWPMITCSTCSGATSARSSAALIAVPPSSVASSVERPPPSLPIGVRAAERITVLGIVESPVRVVAGGFAGVRVAYRWWHSVDQCPRRRCTSRSSDRRVRTRPIRRDADTIAVGVFEGEGVAHDLPGGALAALLDVAARRSATFKHARRHPRRRRRADPRRARRPRAVRRRARPRRRRGRARRARELGRETLCWEVPHHVGDDVVAGARRGHGAARLPLRPLQADRADDSRERRSRR